MNVKDYQQCYYDMSAKVSELVRTLSLAGLALIWIFKLDDDAGVRLDWKLVLAAALIVAALAFDLLQYLYLTITWLIVSYVYESKYGHDREDLGHSEWLPRVGEIIFGLKVCALIAGYSLIGVFLWKRLLIEM